MARLGIARGELFGMILATMRNTMRETGTRALPWLLLLLSASLLSSQSPTPAGFRSQEREAEGEHEERPLTKEQMREFSERLRRLVNGKAAVKNQCQLQGQQVEVDESSQISEISGCKITLVTGKTTDFASGPRQVEFTLSANLADLTTPAAVQTQAFAQCKPIGGVVVKLMSRAAPGKTVRVSRRENSANANPTESLRGDLSFFFPDLAAAQRAARTLDRMVKTCGGNEWPDDDDLP